MVTGGLSSIDVENLPCHKPGAIEVEHRVNDVGHISHPAPCAGVIGPPSRSLRNGCIVSFFRFWLCVSDSVEIGSNMSVNWGLKRDVVEREFNEISAMRPASLTPTQLALGRVWA